MGGLDYQKSAGIDQLEATLDPKTQTQSPSLSSSLLLSLYHFCFPQRCLVSPPGDKMAAAAQACMLPSLQSQRTPSRVLVKLSTVGNAGNTHMSFPEEPGQGNPLPQSAAATIARPVCNGYRSYIVL